MLLPGDRGSTVDNLSRFFGGEDITDDAGHAFLFAILTILWAGALCTRMSARRALVSAAGVGLLLGTGTEIAQFGIDYRGVSFLDLAANWVGVAAGVALLLIAARVRQTPPEGAPPYSGRV